AFALAEKMPFDQVIVEEALFNYAKLAYDLSYNPNNEAILAFQKYIKNYPNSPKLEEAYTCLVNLFLTTKNYKDALASIDNVKLKDDRLKEAYQKIAFYRGVELFNDGEFNSTLVLFNKSLNQNFDKSVRAQTIYWKGEAYYRLLDYDSAKISYKEFLITPGAFSSPLFNMAQYNLGYCNFKKKNYADANISFRKFVTNKKNEDVKIINDAYVRIGDCYFIGKDYSSAIENYESAIKIKAIDVDYAMFQKSLASGALGKFDLKKETLLNLISNYPKSDFSADAKFELANTYQVQGNNEKALEYFSAVVKDYPASSYVKKSLLKTGLIYFNADKNEQALVTFKKIVADFPGTNESKEALLSIQNIYIELDKVEDFFAYVKTLPFANVSNSDQDSITYVAVENRYMSGDCENSIKGFSNYIEKFPKGAFIVNANFYKAECDYNNNNLQAALTEYEFVSRASNSKFIESALVKAASINLKLKNYKDALQQYIKIEEIAEFKSNILDAIIGQMRCNVLLNNNIQTLASSRKLLGVEKVSEDLKSECHLNIAKAALAMDSLALAQTEFEITTKLTKNEAAAEAKYNLALIQFKQLNYAESQKLIFESINQVPSYDYWIAKCFLLLSDNYVKTGNVFQAKHTLQSIIDNYEGAELVKEAHEKLKVILEAQKLEEQKKAQEDMNNKFPKDKNNEDSNEIK
ncbi:MAG: tetratricopeptide repeat protein, partial [Bacteroidetes bacterium]|nr:tetratricopeptide repeat protein [Bacteroidota bacterium]